MAFMNQERKKELAPWIKKVFDKYWIKWSLSVRDHQVLIATLQSWSIDFIHYLREDFKNRYDITSNNDINVNIYHLESIFEGVALDFMLELRNAMMVWNHDNSDAMTDYFDVGWYVDINIGSYDKEYIVK